jgi:hypothetical protein
MKTVPTNRRNSAIAQRLVLMGMRVEELRDLSRRFLRIDPSGLSASNLRQKLAVATEDDAVLSNELGGSPFSFKPSFYLMIAKIEDSTASISKLARTRSSIFFDNINKELEEESDSPLREFRIVHTTLSGSGVLELQITWHHIVHYLSTNAKFQHVYALKPGFIFLDLTNEKALVCCHTIRERDLLAQACEKHLNVSLSPITLTKGLLGNVGAFEKIRRAAYLATKPASTEPQEITFADEHLGTKADATAKEGSTKYVRKHSFYRVDLGGLSEAGVGVTSDTAKLWISADTPIDSVRDYGLLLLKKFTTTLKKMKNDGDIPGILKILSLQRSPVLATVVGGELRQEVSELAHQIIQMLLTGQSERPFTPSPVFLSRAVPSLFNPARIQLEDEATGMTSFWSDGDKARQFVSFALKSGKWKMRVYNRGRQLDLDALRHPMTGNIVSVPDPLRAVELWPTPKLHDILVKIIAHAASQLSKLKNVVVLPFHITSGRLVLDIANVKNSLVSASLKEEVDANTVRQFKIALQQTISTTESTRLGQQLVQLKEKCAHMSDHNCENCLEQRKFLCLRSLTARFLASRQLLMHKGIELSDLQGSLDIAGERRRVWFFSKLAAGNSGLTLRNDNGAILLAQIINQLDKSTFDTIGILTPSIINEDLRERVSFLSGLVGKRVMVVNRSVLEKLLTYFEEQTRIDNKKPEKVYSASRSEKAKGKESEAAGTFV